MSQTGSLTSAFIKPMIQAWLGSLNCTKDSSKNNRMFLQREIEERNVVRFGIIQFYDRSIKRKAEGRFYGDIMELTIYDIPKDIQLKAQTLTEVLMLNQNKAVFYLHFEMHDIEFVLEQISSFFKFFYGVDDEKQEMKLPSKIENILICCTTGLTSGYFANLMQQKLDENEDNTVVVRGDNVRFLPDYIEECDIILLAPQIYYMEKELKEKYGDKIQLLDRVDFATFNFNAVLEKLSV